MLNCKLKTERQIRIIVRKSTGTKLFIVSTHNYREK